MALEDGRLNSAISRAGNIASQARSALVQTTSLAKKSATLIGSQIRRTQSHVRDVSDGLASEIKKYRLPRWMRIFKVVFLRAHRAWAPLRNTLASWTTRPIVRFISRSLLNRILASNLLGFAILVLGFLYLSQSSTVLIEEKRRALEVQAEMIAAAIASGAKIDSDFMQIDPDKLPLDRDTMFPTRGDAFTRHEMDLAPEELAPILKRMVRATRARARVLNFEGRLIIDTASLLSAGEIVASNITEEKDTSRPKNFWTRIIEFMIGREFEVYRELESTDATNYPEVNRALTTGKNQAMMLLTDTGEQIVTAIVPIRRTRSVQGIVMLSSREGEMSEILRKNRNAIWPLALVALLASLVTSYLLSRTVGGPMSRLSKSAEDVSRNINAANNLPELTGRTDEVAQMARAFRSMTKALLRRIAASEKFAADVAHELKNPLTAASSTAQSLEYAKTPEQRQVLVEQIQIELKRLNRLITDVSSASRLDAELARQAQDPVDIKSTISDIVPAFKPKCEDVGCHIELSFETCDVMKGSASPYTVTGNAGRIAQVMTNLIDNAISFSGRGDRISITVKRSPDWVQLIVDDQGPGIDDEKLETIFERFYTYRPTEESSRGSNSGLGLNISREIIAAHNGHIWAENRTDGDNKQGRTDKLGARFVVELPARGPNESDENQGWSA